MKHPRLLSEKYDLSAETIRLLLEYDAVNGRFVWKMTPERPVNWNRRYAGREAGYINSHGRRIIAVMSGDKKRRYQATWLAWLLMTGKWPIAEVDHVNTHQADDRWLNLRAATSSQNSFNTKAGRRNTSGFKGVSRHHTGRFLAQIMASGIKRNLGLFDTPEEASAAYAVAASELHGEFARLA